MRVLVVEDEKDLNSIICSKLVKEGYNVDACYDGQAALDYMEAENYDGAIMDAGASDYMTKPFEFSELMARLRVMLRTQNPVNENVITCGSLVVDMNNRQAIRDGKVIDLTVREYAILEYLARNRNVVVTREQIRVNIWNIDDDVNSNVIDVYIRYLRRKIDDNYEEKLIHTIRGVGYKLEC